MGNICRSPTAEGVFRSLLEQRGLLDRIEIDSAGTHGHYHAGEQPDRRAREMASRKGVDLAGIHARPVEANDFQNFDYVVAMDMDNYNDLKAACPETMRQKLHLLLDFAPALGIREVPDPYYGGRAGFERVFDMIEQAAVGLLDEIMNTHSVDK